MELRICTEPQEGATYAQLLAVARSAREHGFGAFFRADHVLPMSGRPAPPGPVGGDGQPGRDRRPGARTSGWAPC